MKDLFEDIRKKVGCNFISDLKYEPYRNTAIRIASQLNVHEYSIREWEDFTQYIYGEESYISSVEDVRVLLLEKLNPRKFRLKSSLKLIFN